MDLTFQIFGHDLKKKSFLEIPPACSLGDPEFERWSCDPTLDGRQGKIVLGRRGTFPQSSVDHGNTIQMQRSTSSYTRKTEDRSCDTAWSEVLKGSEVDFTVYERKHMFVGKLSCDGKI